MCVATSLNLGGLPVLRDQINLSKIVFPLDVGKGGEEKGNLIQQS